MPSSSWPWAAAASKKVLTSDKLGRGVLVSRAASVTSRKSLRSSLIRKPGPEITGDDLRTEIVQLPRRSGSGANRFKRERRIQSAADRQQQRLDRRLQVDRDGDLVDQLGHLAAAARTHVSDAFAELIEKRARAVESVRGCHPP